MNEAIKFGQSLQEKSAQPQVMSANNRKGWFTKIRKSFKNKLIS